MSTDDQSESPQPLPDATLRGVASLLIFVHLFFVFVALSGNWLRSPLQARILEKFAFYTQLFNFDPDFTPYHLTAGQLDGDYRVEVLPAGRDAADDAAWITLPEPAWRTPRYRRYQRLGMVFGELAGDDEQAARIAESVALHFLHRRGVQPAQVRARRHLPQSREQRLAAGQLERDPHSSLYLEVPYAADVLVMGDEVGVKKHESSAQVAQPGTAAASQDESRP